MQNDFSSLDKLVEFGLGVGIATQMMNTMNTVIARTAVPGVGINPGVQPQPATQQSAAAAQSACPAQWYAVIDKHVCGPLQQTEIEQLIDRQLLDGDTFVWQPGMPSWQPANNVPEIYKAIILANPEIKADC